MNRGKRQQHHIALQLNLPSISLVHQIRPNQTSASSTSADSKGLTYIPDLDLQNPFENNNNKQANNIGFNSFRKPVLVTTNLPGWVPQTLKAHFHNALNYTLSQSCILKHTAVYLFICLFSFPFCSCYANNVRRQLVSTRSRTA